MPDLQRRGIYTKAALFVLIIALAAGLLLAQNPTWQTALATGLLAWASARLYYFAFYVIEKYVDPEFKFSGVVSALVFLFRRPPGR